MARTEIWRVGLAVAAWLNADVVQAQQKTASRIVDVIGGLMVNAQTRRQIAAISQPLEYDSSLPALDPGDPADPRNMDIAGLRLGMNVPDARRTLRRAGFSIQDERMEGSFAMSARPLANANMPQDVREWQASGPSGQRLTVRFVSLPDGAVVDRIEFTAPADAMTQDAFVTQIASRYGEAELVNDGELVWCVGPPTSCAADHASKRQPFLAARPEERSVLLVYDDPARDAALEARLDELRNPRPPQIGRAAF